MIKFKYKAVLVVVWVVIVFSNLWMLGYLYDKDKGFTLFVLLTIAGNLAYDGLKIVLRYDPMFISDLKVIYKFIIGYIFSLVGAFIFLIVGAQLFIYQILSEPLAQAFASIGFLACMVAGVILVNKAEKIFRVTNRA